MRRLIAALPLGVLLMLILSPPSSAQYGRSVPGRAGMWNVRAGVVFPSGNTVNNTEFIVGIEHVRPTRGLGDVSLSVDYTGIETRTGDGNRRASLLPIFVSLKNNRIGGDPSNWDLGVGVGLYWAVDDIPDMRLDSGAHFAWQLEAAYHFTPQYFADVRYMASEHTGDSGLLGLQAGYTF